MITEMIVLETVESKIKKHVKETVYDDREDLSQELKIKIIEKIDIFKNEEIPGLFEYIQSNITK
ncbi:MULTISPECIES: hypothetical protein [unclassified Oceanobacillus]|uniref:hypothetical protein n=1 Tax=unclassified Oceanobacillus TaxID=2630292 RepID=UPI00300E3FC2